ncbi:NmrA-like protein 4 [Elsinoe fawcettii]|nr:NmrA-like protein 4 [Elsinoe fawcettii]
MATKILAVFGASGNQGGSVIKTVLSDATLSSKFKIRAIGRDTSKPGMTKWADQGIETVAADMSSSESVSSALKDAHSVFLMTNFWESLSADTEFAQAKTVVDAALAAKVEHLIFSSLINVTEASGGRLSHVSHFDGKAKIEQYIRQSGIPSTFVLPGMFMSQFLGMIRNSGDGSYALALPVDGDKARFPLLDAATDTGAFVAEALRDPAANSGKRIYAAENVYSPNQMIEQFAQVLGKQAQFQQVPGDVFKSFLPQGVAQELLENMLLMEEPGYYGGAGLDDGPRPGQEGLTTWKAFVESNKAAWA